MGETIIVALISLVGTLAGAFGGVMTSSRLTGYRIEQLEKKIEGLDIILQKIYKLEELTSLQEEKIKQVEHRVDKLEDV